ncbi:MAG: GAF domain-containing protein [Proteobacteria bacterium]|nr:GAF domain-containing protein [Pseudomonadota bacterium]
MHIDLQNTITAVVAGLAGIFAIATRNYFASHLEKFFKGELDPVVATLNTTKLVRDSLHRLMNEWNANRAFIVQFHNGGHFYNGSSMQKMSVTYEEHAPGVFPIFRTLQNIPITTCGYTKDIIDMTYMVEDIENVTDIIAQTFYYEFGIRSAIGVPILSGGKVIGAVILHYTDKKAKFVKGDLDLLSAQCGGFHTLLKLD